MTLIARAPSPARLPPRTSAAHVAERPDRAGRTASALIVGYVALWIVEGAFRKWVPGTDTLFYVARDVFAVLVLVWLASSRTVAVRRLPWWAVGVVGLLGVWLALQYLEPGSPSPTILLFGLRSYIAPFLFAVLCLKYATRWTLGHVTGLIAATIPFELAVTVLQVLSPPTAFINVQVGGSPNAFVNGGEVVRATGTFSAPLGFTVYLLIALVVALSWTVRIDRRGRGWLLVAVVLGAVALSGARGAVLNSAVLIAVYLLYSLAQGTGRSLGRVVGLAALLVVALIAVQALLPEVLASFITRFNDASVDEDSGSRLTDWFFGYLGQAPTLLGEGMGARSNAGIALGSTAGWIENDSLRWVAELGVLGYLFSLARSVAAIVLAIQTVLRLRRDTAEATLVRGALVVLLALGSVNETPMNEGGFGILLGALVLCSVPQLRRPSRPARSERAPHDPRTRP
jgi:hypothetical protein